MRTLSHKEFIDTLADLMSKDPAKVRQANRLFYQAMVSKGTPHPSAQMSADLALAEAASK